MGEKPKSGRTEGQNFKKEKEEERIWNEEQEDEEEN